jgi:hypothetical protein
MAAPAHAERPGSDLAMGNKAVCNDLAGNVGMWKAL